MGVLCQHLISLHRDSLLGPRGNSALRANTAACPASSSPPPHLLTETGLQLFLTLQLPLAWGSPFLPTPSPGPNRVPPACHPESGSTTCRLVEQENKTVTAQSPEIPHPDTFRNGGGCLQEPELGSSEGGSPLRGQRGSEGLRERPGALVFPVQKVPVSAHQGFQSLQAA